MADTNIPFTVGELWLADGEGKRRRLVEVTTGEVQQVTYDAGARWPVWVAETER